MVLFYKICFEKNPVVSSWELVIVPGTTLDHWPQNKIPCPNLEQHRSMQPLIAIQIWSWTNLAGVNHGQPLLCHWMTSEVQHSYNFNGGPPWRVWISLKPLKLSHPPPSSLCQNPCKAPIQISSQKAEEKATAKTCSKIKLQVQAKSRRKK